MKLFEESADVLVVGGGSAGVIAAVQAARAGARTVLLERWGQLGGTITTGGVSAPAYFYDGTHQVIAGIGWELVQRVKELDGSPMPDFAHPTPRRPSFHVPVNPATYALLAEEFCVQAGVALHYHEIAVAAAPVAGGYQVESVGKGLRRIIRACEVIDCTGDADLAAWAGATDAAGVASALW